MPDGAPRGRRRIPTLSDFSDSGISVLAQPSSSPPTDARGPPHHDLFAAGEALPQQVFNRIFFSNPLVTPVQ
jgi:hypothetical protein